jgi:hypothetical protein
MKNFAKWSGVSLASINYRGTIGSLVNQKMQVLRDFYIVDENNEVKVREYLMQYLRDHPNHDPQIALDHAASPLIRDKMNRIL